MDRPLISFVVACYNQEQYVRECLQGAFAQTYSPLEILFSDDCSSDRSFEIAREMAAAYQGPHVVKLNRNPRNLGIGPHANRVMELTAGELVVINASDDVSLPERTQVIFDAWDQTGRQATSLFSSYTTISGEGQELGLGGLRGDAADTRPYRELEGSLTDYLSTKSPAVNGCTHAWSRELFSHFGPLTSDLEDLVLSFRTLAIGKMVYIQQPLVRYRRHESNVSFLAERDDTRSFEHREKRLRWVNEKTAKAYENMLADVETLHQKGRLTAGERELLREIGRRKILFHQDELQLMDGNLFRRFCTVAGVLRRGDLRCTLRFMPRTLPRRLYRRFYLLRARWRGVFRRHGAAALDGAK